MSEQTLQAQITALQQQVAQLARRQQQDETLQPTYLTISPSGTVGALFTGGVQMIEETSSTYSPGRALGWLDSAGGGEIRESILGYFSGSDHVLILQSRPDFNDAAQLLLFADANGALGKSQVLATVQDSSGGDVGVKIIDSAGNSSFAFANAAGATVNITAAPYNAKGDLTEAFFSISSGIATVTNNTLNFTTADNGKTMVVNDFGNGLSYVGTLSGITGSQNTATIAPVPGSSFANLRGAYGTDNTAAFQAAINAIAAGNPDFGSGGGTISVPGFIAGAGTPLPNGPGLFGKYLFAGQLDFTNIEGLVIRGEGQGAVANAMPELRFIYSGTQSAMRMYSCAGVVLENLAIRVQNTLFFGDIIDYDHTTVGTPSDPINCGIYNCAVAVWNAGSPRSLVRMNRTIFSRIRDSAFQFGYTPILWGGDALDSQGTTAGYVNVCKLENNTTNDSLLAHIYIDSGDCEACVIDNHGFENMINAGILGSSRCLVSGLDIRNPWMGDVTNNGNIWFKNLYCAVNGSRITGGLIGSPGASGGYIQTLTQAGAATSTWSLALSGGFGGPDTATGIPANATAAQVQSALQALPHVGNGGVTCTGGPLGTAPVVCTFSISYNSNLIPGSRAPVGLQGLNVMTVPSQPTGATITVTGIGGALLNLGGAKWEISGGYWVAPALFDMTAMSGGGGQSQAADVEVHGITSSVTNIFQNGTLQAGSYSFHDNFSTVSVAYLPPTVERRWILKTVSPGAYTFNIEDLEKILQNTNNGVNVTYTIPLSTNFYVGSNYGSGSAPPNIGQRISLKQAGAGTITLAAAGGVTLLGGSTATINNGDRLFAEYLGSETWSAYYAT